MNAIGWLGSALLAICGLPQAVACWRQGHARGMAPAFLAMWGGGEILTPAYVASLNQTALLPLILNYGLNLSTLAVIVWFKLWPRGEHD